MHTHNMTMFDADEYGTMNKTSFILILGQDADLVNYPWRYIKRLAGLTLVLNIFDHSFC